MVESTMFQIVAMSLGLIVENTDPVGPLLLMTAGAYLERKIEFELEGRISTGDDEDGDEPD